MTITYHRNLIQGSDEWLAARCGLLTASEVKLILTPSLKAAKNEKQRAHLWELAAQRITRHVEPTFISDDMLRGREDEIEARLLYERRFAPVEEVGFVTNDRWGFVLGCSPDGLVGADGMIECKSRRQRFQVETILRGCVPEDYWLQIQTALLVTERAWCDFISYSGGLPMVRIRAEPDPVTQDAIIEAAADCERQIAGMLAEYPRACANLGGIPTERRVEQEMHL